MILISRGMIYHISRGNTYENIEHELYDNDLEIETSHHAISNRYKLGREIYFLDLDFYNLNRGKIRGQGSVVEVDEMKFGKRKYNVGRIVEGSWLVGIIDHDANELRVEICPSNIRDANIFLRIINDHVEKATTTVNDCWMAYSSFTADGFNHLTVCDKYNFIDPATYANTQKIESSWRPLRSRLSFKGVDKDNLADHLGEYFQDASYKKIVLILL
jgi:hypothetical protein